ncbi:MAG: 4Fe-4S cluster-binding domain-containing protein [Anaerolineae bacterium]|nr:4Fe-4S cluster-binding domain-containing protein [Anaerolineae bacterium]
MTRLRIPPPYSAGLFLTYKCNSDCKHCMYVCSPQWPADWIAEQDAEAILTQLARIMGPKYDSPQGVSLNEGLHFTGGEPFLNYPLLLRLVGLAAGLELPGLFVETNAFWCRDDADTRQRMLELQAEGLQGLLISANPFLLERVPFERTRRAARIGYEVFGHNAFLYQRYFFLQFERMGLEGTLPFDEYLRRGAEGLRHVELLLNGRVGYSLGDLLPKQPAERFLGMSCRQDLLRDWHIHIDNYGHYLPGYCGGLSLGDCRELERLAWEGIDLDERPVLQALLGRMGELYALAQQRGYQPLVEGYVSKCHLCLDIRRHLAAHAAQDEFPELAPRSFYDRIYD